MKSFLAKYWPSLVSIASVAAGYLTPAVQAYAAAHQAQAAVILGAWMVILHHLPSPSH